MVSLKGLIPGLARFVEMKPAAIYERQRALVRAGMLVQRPGHGPGSGVLATPKSAAILLISLVATANLSEVENKTKIAANLKSTTQRCPVTGERTLAKALTAVLSNRELSKRASALWVERGGPESYAAIAFGEPFNMQLSRFGKSEASGHHLTYRISLLFPFYDLAAYLALWKERE
jgi:hypothetical protein